MCHEIGWNRIRVDEYISADDVVVHICMHHAYMSIMPWIISEKPCDAFDSSLSTSL